MLKYIFISFTLLIIVHCQAVIRYVNANGTAEYTTVQSAINASANSDTVLVYQGIYVENIDTSGKSITLASMYLLEPLESYKHDTILDGNNTSSVVYIHLGESVKIIGFTIRHGFGKSIYGDHVGGGVLNRNNSHTELNSCILTANQADGGGGIICRQFNSYSQGKFN
jgi:hypothetical protein